MTKHVLNACQGQGEGALDDQERVKQVKEIQGYLAEKVYYGTGVSGAAYIGVQPWVTNYMPANGGFGVGAETWAKVWLDKQR